MSHLRHNAHTGCNFNFNFKFIMSVNAMLPIVTCYKKNYTYNNHNGQNDKTKWCKSKSNLKRKVTRTHAHNDKTKEKIINTKMSFRLNKTKKKKSCLFFIILLIFSNFPPKKDKFHWVRKKLNKIIIKYSRFFL